MRSHSPAAAVRALSTVPCAESFKYSKLRDADDFLSHEDILQPRVNTGGNAALRLETSPCVPRDSWTLARPDCPSACGHCLSRPRGSAQAGHTLTPGGGGWGAGARSLAARFSQPYRPGALAASWAVKLQSPSRDHLLHQRGRRCKPGGTHRKLTGASAAGEQVITKSTACPWF